MTENGGKAWKQTIFYPFFYASKYGRGYVLEGITDISKYDTKWYSDVPDVDTAAVLSEDGESLTIFAVNRDINEKINLEVSLLDFEGFVPAEYIALEDCDAEDINTKDLEKVRPVRKELPVLDGKKLNCPLKPMSWNMIRLIKKNG